jgi:shikimate kinase
MKRGERPVIIIVGPKHSGKTCAGKALARLWEEDPAPEGGEAAGPENKKPPAVFIDLDEVVEEWEGKSPRLLYREGPEVFRRAEAEALRALLGGSEQKAAGGQGGAGEPGNGDRERIILAAGGGLADNRKALEILKNSPQALIVHIEVPAETAWERIRAAAEKTGELPPFLDTENPRETHRRLHERRGKIYRELAEITLAAGNTPEETAAALLRQLKRGRQ